MRILSPEIKSIFMNAILDIREQLDKYITQDIPLDVHQTKQLNFIRLLLHSMQNDLLTLITSVPS